MLNAFCLSLHHRYDMSLDRHGCKLQLDWLALKHEAVILVIHILSSAASAAISYLLGAPIQTHLITLRCLQYLCLNCPFNVYTALICPILVIPCRVLLYSSLRSCLNFPIWVISWILYPWELPSITCIHELGAKNLARDHFNGSGKESISHLLSMLKLYLSSAWKPSFPYLVEKVQLCVHDSHFRLYSASFCPL